MNMLNFLASETAIPFSDWMYGTLLKPNNSNAGSGFWGTDNAFIVITWINIIFFLTVVVPMVYFVMKYRRRAGVSAQRTPNHNTLLEVTWVVGPLAILTVLFFWGFQGYMKSQIARGGGEVIHIEGWKWAWEATYANGAKSQIGVYLDDYTHLPSNAKAGKMIGSRGNSLIPVFVVPEGVPVQFMLKSRDVMHSFYIPDMRVKMDLFPNRYTSLTIVPQNSDKSKSQAGQLSAIPADEDVEGRDHYVFCAEYCGQQHSEMAAILRVVKPEVYKKTLVMWANRDEVEPLDVIGENIYKRQCATCHTIDGSKNTGPTWKDAWGTEVTFTDGTKLSQVYGKGGDLNTAWTNYTRQSIIAPAEKIHEGFANQMTSFAGQFSDRQIMGIQAYFRKLANKALPEDSVKPEKKKAN